LNANWFCNPLLTPHYPTQISWVKFEEMTRFTVSFVLNIWLADTLILQFCYQHHELVKNFESDRHNLFVVNLEQFLLRCCFMWGGQLTVLSMCGRDDNIAQRSIMPEFHEVYSLWIILRNVSLAIFHVRPQGVKPPEETAALCQWEWWQAKTTAANFLVFKKSSRYVMVTEWW
jgi:hypothetical protein